MKHFPSISVFLLVSTMCLAPAFAVPVTVSGLAPNWDQPYDYPDAFDASGPPMNPNPGMPGDPWDDWCVPVSAAMLIGHWEDVFGRVGLADGSPDGNQGGANTYGGPGWPARSWHDRTADGTVLRGTGGIEDLGWYMDTNDRGNPAFPNPHDGTYYMDVAPGLNDFFTAVGTGVGQPAENLVAATQGTGAAFGGLTEADLRMVLQTEINANRTAIAHFTHWNLIGPGGPGQGNGMEIGEGEFIPGEYSFGSPSMGKRDEVWNLENGEFGLGHSVTVVGYDTDLFGNVSHLIVHDNWPTTVRNVKVPVGALGAGELVAITTVIPEPSMLALWVFGGVGLVWARRRRR